MRMLVGLSSRPLNDMVVVRKVSHKRPLKDRKADRLDIEAQDFLQRNPNWDLHDSNHVENLKQFLKENSVSVLALRKDDAVKFLDILAKVCASRIYRPVSIKDSQYFHRCRLRVVIPWLHRMISGSTRRTFAGCHIGRSGFLEPFSSAA